MKRAVIWGVNQYCNFPEAELRGARNDSTAMAAFAEIELGIAHQDVTLLMDRLATRGAIWEALERAVRDSRWGDYLFIWRSSHGTQIPDLDGDERDGYDEASVVYDSAEVSGEWDRKTLIVDDDLRTLFARLPDGVLVEMGSDTCYSETGLKRLGQTYDRARLLVLPRGYKDPPKRHKRLGLAVPYSNLIHWAACAENDTSADAHIEGMWQGAGTWAFRMEYRPEDSRGDLIFRMKKRLRDNHFGQVPALECLGTLARGAVGAR